MKEQIREILEECRLQLEYLNEKFGETGTTNSLLAKIELVLAEKIPISQTNSLLIAMLESQLKVEKIKQDSIICMGKTSYMLEYILSSDTILELERQINELKK